LGPSGSSKDLDQRRALGEDFADLGGGDLAALKLGAEGGGVFWGNGDEEAARSLRVEEEGAGIFIDGGGKFDAGFDEFAIAFEAASEKAAVGCFARSRQARDLCMVDAKRNAAASGHFARVAEEAETGDVGDGVNGRIIVRGFFNFMQNFGGVAIEACHGSDGGLDGAHGGLARFERRGDQAGADRLCKNQGVARLGTYVAPDIFWVDDAGNGVAEFQIIVANRMAADDGAMSLIHLRKTAAENLFQNSGAAVIGESDNRERGNGPATHGVNVTKGIRGGDLAEREWIVGDGREEIDGLHKGEVGGELIHPCVVAGVETNEQIRISRPRQAAKHGVQKTWTQLGRSTSGLGGGRQTHRICQGASLLTNRAG